MSRIISNVAVLVGSDEIFDGIFGESFNVLISDGFTGKDSLDYKDNSFAKDGGWVWLQMRVK